MILNMSDVNKLALLIKKFKTAFTPEEALDIINQSDLRRGTLSTGLFRWDSSNDKEIYYD